MSVYLNLKRLIAGRLINSSIVVYADMAYGFAYFIILDQLFTQQIESRIAFVHIVGIFVGFFTLQGINLSGHTFVAKNLDKIHSIKRFIFFEIYLRLIFWFFLTILSTTFLIVKFFTIYEYIYILSISLFPLLGMQWYFLGVRKSFHYLIVNIFRFFVLGSIVFLKNIDEKIFFIIISSTTLISIAYINLTIKEISFFTIFFKRKTVTLKFKLNRLLYSFKKRLAVALTNLMDVTGTNMPFILIGISGFKDLLLPILLLFRFSKTAIAISSPVILMIVGKYSNTQSETIEKRDLFLLILSGIFSVFIFYTALWIYYQGSSPLNHGYFSIDFVVGFYTFFIVISGGLTNYWIVSKQKFRALAKGQFVFAILITVMFPFYFLYNPTTIFAVLLIAELVVFVYYYVYHLKYNLKIFK